MYERRGFEDWVGWLLWKISELASATSVERSSYQLQSRLKEHIHFFTEIDEPNNKVPHVSLDATDSSSSTQLLPTCEAIFYKPAHSIALLQYT